MKKAIIFLIASVLLWFPLCFGLAAAADVARVPDTEVWLWIIRIFAGLIAAGIGWMIVGAKKLTDISVAAMAMIAVISNILLLVCFVLAAVAVVMIFVKDAQWLYDHIYQPFFASLVTIILISVLPFSILLMFFRATRAVGGLVLYILSFFLGYSLWFYSLMIAGSHGPGWVIGGVLVAGVGVFFTAMISSAVWGQWAVAGGILLSLLLIWFGGWLGMTIAAWQFEKFREAEQRQEVVDDAA
jgi:hypothetical protein